VHPLIRLVAVGVVALLANAVALLVGAIVLPNMSLNASGYLTAVLLFTVIAVLIEPLIRQSAMRSSPALLGSSSLVATLVSLILTAIIGDGLAISGLVTWVLATVVVWLVALGARLLLPLLIFKKVLSDVRND